MSDVRPTYDDEFDFFEFFETLWDSKWLISAFIAISVLLSGGFLLLKDPVYESKLIYSVNTNPPFSDANNVLTDFKKKFYSVSVFDEWKKNNSDSSLVYDDLSLLEVVDGFVLSKKEAELATLAFNNKDSYLILVKSNQLRILDDVFEYATFINGLLRYKYIALAKNELKFLQAHLEDFKDSRILQNMSTLDRYINSAEMGESVLEIMRPTMPKKISPKSFLTLTLSIVLGGIVGVFFILVRNAITKRKEQ